MDHFKWLFAQNRDNFDEDDDHNHQPVAVGAAAAASAHNHPQNAAPGRGIASALPSSNSLPRETPHANEKLKPAPQQQQQSAAPEAAKAQFSAAAAPVKQEQQPQPQPQLQAPQPAKATAPAAAVASPDPVRAVLPTAPIATTKTATPAAPPPVVSATKATATTTQAASAASPAVFASAPVVPKLALSSTERKDPSPAPAKAPAFANPVGSGFGASSTQVFGARSVEETSPIEKFRDAARTATVVAAVASSPKQQNGSKNPPTPQPRVTLPNEPTNNSNNNSSNEDKGFFSRLFSGGGNDSKPQPQQQKPNQQQQNQQQQQHLHHRRRASFPNSNFDIPLASARSEAQSLFNAPPSIPSLSARGPNKALAALAMTPSGVFNGTSNPTPVADSGSGSNNNNRVTSPFKNRGKNNQNQQQQQQLMSFQNQNQSSSFLPPGVEMLPIVAQSFTPGSTAALRAQRATVSIGFSGACTGALVLIDGLAWVITSTEAVFDANSNEYLKLVQLSIRSPCIPKHFQPDALFVASPTDVHRSGSVALLRLSADYAALLAPLCVELSCKVCALHTTLRGFQVEVPFSRRVFDEEHIYGASCVSAVNVTIVQTRSEFSWRALPDVAASVNAVAGAVLFDEIGDVVAVMVGTGTMLTASAFHQRYDASRGQLAPDSDREFLHRDYQMTRLKHQSFSRRHEHGGAAAAASVGGGGKHRGGGGAARRFVDVAVEGGGNGGAGSNTAPPFVSSGLEWNEVTLTTLECAVALDNLIGSAAHAMLFPQATAQQQQSATSAGGGSASAGGGFFGTGNSAATVIAGQQKHGGHGVSRDEGDDIDDLRRFAKMPQPSTAALAMSSVLPRILRLGSQPVSWCFVHARDAASRMTEVNPGSVKLVHGRHILQGVPRDMNSDTADDDDADGANGTNGSGGGFGVF